MLIISLIFSFLFTFDQHLLEHNITGEISRIVVYLANGKFQVVGRTNPRHTDIELAVGKAGIIQPNTYILESLTLRLIDRHGKSYSDWELAPAPFKREFSIFWPQGDPWY